MMLEWICMSMYQVVKRQIIYYYREESLGDVLLFAMFNLLKYSHLICLRGINV